MTGPIGPAPRPTPPQEPSRESRVKTLSQKFSKAIGAFVEELQAIKHSPHLADSRQALTTLANHIKALHETSKEAAHFKD